MKPQKIAVFSVEALYVALDARRRREHLLWRDIAKQAGCAASTFTRMGLYGQAPNAENLARMLLWLGNTDLAPFLAGIANQPDRQETQ
jgi:hypothetical protein